MQTVLNPRWLFLVNTLPILILFSLYFGAYQIIGTLLSEEHINAWIETGSSLAVLFLANLLYTFWAIRNDMKVSVVYAATAIFSYITFIYLYEMQSSDIIPRDIPSWMLPNNMILYVGTFVMPTLAHALLVLIVHSTSEEGEKTTYGFLNYILPPILWFVAIILIIPFWKPIGHRNLEQHISIVLVVIACVIFLFFVGRIVYLYTVKRRNIWAEPSVISSIIFGIILPIAALLLNTTIDNFFGNFTNYWFYGLTAFNGVVLSMPELGKPVYRLFLFLARCISYPFIVYFFLIFLPYTPLSLPLLLALGLGFLLLLPMILMILQTNVMRTDFDYLDEYYPKTLVRVVFALGILVIPASVTFSFWQEKNALYQALDYVYEPNLADKNPDKINTSALKEVIGQIRRHKERRWDWNHTQTPFISPFYNWFVLDNMTVSPEKINLLEAIFLGTHYQSPDNLQNARTKQVKLTKLNTSTKYDSLKKQYSTWVDLEITDTDTSQGRWQQGEFETFFELPEGVWISDYYLWIEKEKVHGLLAEKKAAMWVYQQITATRRDPGILNYVSGNKIRFRVFPFSAAGEVRKTGIELLHKEPLLIKNDSNEILIAPQPPKGESLFEFPLRGLGGLTPPSGAGGLFFSYDSKAAYLSASYKKTLPKVKRKPYLHFIVDCSESKKLHKSDYKNIIQKLIKNNQNLSLNSKITFANAYTKTVNIKHNWQKMLEEQEFSNGFYLERAIEQILYEEIKNPSNTFPVIFVIASKNDKPIINKNFADYRNVLVENENYYLANIYLTDEHYLVNKLNEVEYSLLDLAKFNEVKRNIVPLTKSKNGEYESLLEKWQKEEHEVLAWKYANKTYYLRNDNKASIVSIMGYHDDDENLTYRGCKRKDWTSALTLQGQYNHLVFSPETTEKMWLKLVKRSFDVQIMTPLTSFISLENEAQRQALLYKQQQVLNSKKSLDIPDTTIPQSMDEPSWWVCGLILLALLAWKKFKT
jgi:hypothetical protein